MDERLLLNSLREIQENVRELRESVDEVKDTLDTRVMKVENEIYKLKTVWTTLIAIVTVAGGWIVPTWWSGR